MLFCDKIYAPKHKDEEARFVKGQHEPLISEALFYDVQDVLDGRKRGQYRLKVASNATLPLRGFLICPKCGKILTGSAPKDIQNTIPIITATWAASQTKLAFR